MTDPSEERVVALDVLRGLAIAAMLLVTHPGNRDHVYAPLEHAPWNGWTPTDLIFPSFLFVVGASMVLSFEKRRERGEDSVALLRHVVKRSVLLYVISLLSSFIPSLLRGDLPPFETIRLLGVLPRIALCYLFAAPVVLFTRPRAWMVITSLLLLGYWCLMTLVPVPGHGAGLLESKEWNLAAYVDRLLLGKHLGEDGSQPWDPEGVLSTLPAIGTTLIGALTGDYLRSRRLPLEKTTGLFVGGATSLVAGMMWNRLFPINKNLWSSSFVLFSAGFALELLAFAHFLIDIRGHRRWVQPFIVFGANPLAALILASFAAAALQAFEAWDPIYRALFASWAGETNGSLAFAICVVLVWLGILNILYRKRIFIRL